jgi:sulfur carrier protein
VPPETIACGAAGRGASAALAIRVNGEARSVPAGCSVSGLLSLLALDRRRIAVAVNREVVPRSAHAARILAPGDRVEILEAVGGG